MAGFFAQPFFQKKFFTDNGFFNEPFFSNPFFTGMSAGSIPTPPPVVVPTPPTGPVETSPFTERICYGLGASIGSGTITVSPYVLVNGVDEKTSMSAINVMDGDIHKFKFAYQSGLTDANLSDTIPLEMADSFTNAGAKEIYYSANTVHAGQHVLGNSMKIYVANGTELKGWWDSVDSMFYLEEI